MERIVLMGPPASGKGTHAARLAADLGIDHVALGDILRHHVEAGDELGRRVRGAMDAGGLVPDGLVVEVLGRRFAELDADAGIVLDGAPRTPTQADLLESDLGFVPEVVLVLTVPEAEIIGRVSGRRVCPNGHVYHVAFEPPVQEDVCDRDGLPLRHRPDDDPDVIRDRLEVYERETTAVVAGYEARGLVRRVDGSGRADDVYPRVREAALSRGPSPS